MEGAISDAELRGVEFKGHQVALHVDQSPRVIRFVVASADGGRLHRERQPRFPAALGGWQR